MPHVHTFVKRKSYYLFCLLNDTLNASLLVGFKIAINIFTSTLTFVMYSNMCLGVYVCKTHSILSPSSTSHILPSFHISIGRMCHASNERQMEVSILQTARGKTKNHRMRTNVDFLWKTMMKIINLIQRTKSDRVKERNTIISKDANSISNRFWNWKAQRMDSMWS